MITIASMLVRLPALDEARLQAWIAQDWVRPVQRGGEWMFAEIDVARVGLILELLQMDVSEGAMPVVLSLLDQLHDTRRQLRRVLQTVDAPDELRRRLSER